MKIICPVGCLILTLLSAKQLRSEERPVVLDYYTTVSLYLTVQRTNDTIGTATGFVVKKKERAFLITNWHVVSGKDPIHGDKVEDPLGRIPDRVKIWHNGKVLGTRVGRTELLFGTNGAPRWVEHPKGHSFDVVALALEAVDETVELYPLDLASADGNMAVSISMPVSIVGFPLGQTASVDFPIWKIGHIASEPELDFEGKPRFLIDATTRSGMSGSPVYLRNFGPYIKKSGVLMMATGITTKFLGIYSAQSNAMEIGIVWKPSVIDEVLEKASMNGL